mmetsp:Transcript_4583/g.8841  ORF Transcript_4583/g.8841 Transcript_4583/m.8841 type:complete len:228 (-) Transcript_4583:256-939(-)|eukprot:CAMPEP_0176503410 /NCGR_PEP_ID=MMETSP0200_2-20121128/15347_1 /TAXON_ID=947934 /ORGANISM="Chaetoceros sp., Strain GSL56" /LENGTH=227 /DNA_ID=CAMNT_0017902697 /DNA_START=562 /DNA_END=1245 /DNA_ORIENTATION=-
MTKRALVQDSTADNHSYQGVDDAPQQDHVVKYGPHDTIQRSKRKRDDETSTHEKVRYERAGPVQSVFRKIKHVETKRKRGRFYSPGKQQLSNTDQSESFVSEKNTDDSPTAIFAENKPEKRCTNGSQTKAAELVCPPSALIHHDHGDKDTFKKSATIKTSFLNLCKKVVPPPPGFARLPTGKTPGRKTLSTLPIGENTAVKDGPFSFGISLQLDNIFSASEPDATSW